MSGLNRVQGRVLPFTALGLLALLAVWLILAPSESRLGDVVKVVYVHGALVWAGLFAFSAAGLLGLAALIVRFLAGAAGPAQTWYRGTQAAGTAALVVWVVYVISSMVVTGLAWGQLVAWNEPRVRVTALILAAAVVLAVVARLVDQPGFTAMVNLAMGIVPWVMVSRVQAIRHPVDPIAGSGSPAIQVYYLLIVLTVVALAGMLLSWLWIRAELRAASVTPGAATAVGTGS